jgi:hypothetical protein
MQRSREPLACSCPHVLTCADLARACQQFPGAESWYVRPAGGVTFVVVPWLPS